METIAKNFGKLIENLFSKLSKQRCCHGRELQWSVFNDSKWQSRTSKNQVSQTVPVPLCWRRERCLYKRITGRLSFFNSNFFDIDEINGNSLNLTFIKCCKHWNVLRKEHAIILHLKFFSCDETDNTSVTCFPSAIHLILCCLLVVFSHIHFKKLQKKKRHLEKERGKGEGESDNACDIRHPSCSLLPFRFDTQVEVKKLT